MGGDRRIATWWKQSVDKAPRGIDAVTPTRVRKSGVCEDGTTGSFAAAALTHEVSRSLALQLHTHVAIMNLRFDPYGEGCGRRQGPIGGETGIGFQVARVPAELRQGPSRPVADHPEPGHGTGCEVSGCAAGDCAVNAGNGSLAVKCLPSAISARTTLVRRGIGIGGGA